MVISLRRYRLTRAISAIVFAVLVVAGIIAELRRRRDGDEWDDTHDEDPRGSFALG